MSDEAKGVVIESQKSLVAKLAEACDAVGGVEKKGRNELQRYDYVKAADVAKAIRHELFKRGVVLIPNELECTSTQISYLNSKNEERRSTEVVLKTAYVITDGVDTLTMHGYGIAWDSGDKAIYKAKTGALKYFLRGLGLIPDEKDDPEADESVDRAAKDSVKRKLASVEDIPEAEQRISQSQVQTFLEACKKSGKTEQQIIGKLAQAECAQVEEIKKGQWNAAIKWAGSTIPENAITSAKQVEDMAPALKDSVRDAKLRKMFASAKSKDIPESDLRVYVKQAFELDSFTKLSTVQIERVIEWIAGVE